MDLHSWNLCCSRLSCNYCIFFIHSSIYSYLGCFLDYCKQCFSEHRNAYISWWDHWESDTTERLRFHFSFSCTGEGNGNPLQCSCLENPRDGRAWWAAVYGVAQSRTRLKRLSSSSSDYIMDSIDLDWVLWDQGFYSVPHTIRHSGNWLWVSYHHACLKITAGYSLLQTLSWVEKKV